MIILEILHFSTNYLKNITYMTTQLEVTDKCKEHKSEWIDRIENELETKNTFSRRQIDFRKGRS